MKKFFCLVIAALMAVMLVSCGNKGASSINPSSGYVADRESANAPTKEYVTDVDYAGDNSAEEYSRKIIKTQNLSLETLEFDEGVKTIEATVEKYGGYLSSSEIANGTSIRYYYSSSSRTASFSVRVPAEMLDGFVKEISEKFNVLSSRLSTEEITDTYYDLKAQYDSLKQQEERIEEMMKKADKLSDLITLDNKLTEIRSKMNYVWSRIQYYDKAVDMSFVNITLYEVQKYAEVQDPTYGERVGEAAGGGWSAFVSFMGEIFIGFLYVFPFLLISGGVAIAVIFIIKGIKKKKANKSNGDNSQNK